MTLRELMALPIIFTNNNYATLRKLLTQEHLLLTAAVQHADAVSLFLTQLAALLCARQFDTALAQLDAALRPSPRRMPTQRRSGRRCGISRPPGRRLPVWSRRRVVRAVLTDLGALWAGPGRE